MAHLAWRIELGRRHRLVPGDREAPQGARHLPRKQDRAVRAPATAEDGPAQSGQHLWRTAGELNAKKPGASKNPIERLSGDQNGDAAPSVPTSGRASV